jgi:hypothetical protein
MKSKDGLIITGPYNYPYHADPIDTMYRPSPKDLKKLLPFSWLEGEIVSAGSYKEEFGRMNTSKKNKKAFKTIFDSSETNQMARESSIVLSIQKISNHYRVWN